MKAPGEARAISTAHGAPVPDSQDICANEFALQTEQMYGYFLKRKQKNRPPASVIFKN
jgi:hypothetical protein